SLRIEIAGKRTDKPRKVGRTTRRPPWPAYPIVRPRTRHGIVIKEASTFEADAGEDVVVERPLHDVAVLAVKLGLQHSMPEQEESDRGARLGIRIFVWKVVIASEPLVFRCRTDPARDVELGGDDILPETLPGGEKVGVTVFPRQSGCSGEQIHRADGMTDHLRLLAQRFMRLHVGIRGAGVVRPKRARIKARNGLLIKVIR